MVWTRSKGQRMKLIEWMIASDQKFMISTKPASDVGPVEELALAEHALGLDRERGQRQPLDHRDQQELDVDDRAVEFLPRENRTLRHGLPPSPTPPGHCSPARR